MRQVYFSNKQRTAQNPSQKPVHAPGIGVHDHDVILYFDYIFTEPNSIRQAYCIYLFIKKTKGHPAYCELMRNCALYVHSLAKLAISLFVPGLLIS